jgi:glutamyl-tRNA synthetase/nondiscriminating glutamyl-tRNA synthetase
MTQQSSYAGKVRVRFAPSPTGQVHVGNARTALVNWLFARQQGGTMVLRIEDTDVERSESRYERQLLEDLKWLGLDWDEGPDVGGPFPPYRQSDKFAVYLDHAERLVSEGKAYYCFCTPEELEQGRELAMKEHRPPIYPGTCRKLDPAEARRRKQAGDPCAIRLHIPEHPIRFHDLVHGAVEFSNEVVSDPIILRSSGVPVYNYVVVIDDAEMKITHVIRGDDHLSNTPKQVALYEALGWPVPEFAHLSTILGPDRERLSKRHGATSVAAFREMGVLPEALMNYMALLGWAPAGGTREIFSPEELVKAFDLRRVTPSPAVFDFEKLYWLNRHYIKERLAWLSAHEPEEWLQEGKRVDLLFSALSFLAVAGCYGEQAKATFIKDDPDETVSLRSPHIRWLLKMVEAFSPAMNKLDELPERAALLFGFEPLAAIGSPENAEVMRSPKTAAVLSAFAARVLTGTAPLTSERFKAMMKDVQKETGVKGKELFHPVRLMLTGAHSGPEFDKLIPLMEEGSQLQLPVHILSVRERVEAFEQARGAAAAPAAKDVSGPEGKR